MKTHDLRAFFEQISLALCKYKRALCGKTVSIFFSPTLSEATRADLDLFFEMPFPYFLSQPFLFSTLEFYGKRQGGDLLGNTKRLPRSPFPRDRLSSVVCKKEEVLKSASV
jgi:hypothetical protein